MLPLVEETPALLGELLEVLWLLESLLPREVVGEVGLQRGSEGRV